MSSIRHLSFSESADFALKPPAEGAGSFFENPFRNAKKAKGKSLLSGVKHCTPTLNVKACELKI
jgi:hypothetical protein